MSVALIAQKAGVSNATVSRVLNNSKPVSAEVAARVKRAMIDLHIRPAQVRRRRVVAGPAPVANKSLAIVGLGQASRGWLDSGIVAQLVYELKLAGMQMGSETVLVAMADPREVPAELRRPEIGGALVLVGGGADSAIAHPLAEYMPTVRVLGGETGSLEVDQVTVDNHAVGNLAATYLMEQGAGELAFLTFNPEWGPMQVRASGFMSAVPMGQAMPRSFIWPRYGQEYRKEYYGADQVVCSQPDQLIAQMAQSRRGRLGLFVSRDEELSQVHPLLEKEGLTIGRDVVVVSCDNEQFRLLSLQPRPASIDIGVSEIARRAVRRLVVRMKYPEDAPVRILVRPRLVDPV